MALFLSTRREGDRQVVEVRGRLGDVTASRQLHDCLDTVFAACPPPTRLVLDLSGVTSCNAASLAAFIGARNRALASGGEVRLVCPPGAVRRALETSRLAQLLPTHPTVTHALADRDHHEAQLADGLP
ncbi:STAS domain-containing protein [Streptomyces sp. NPDC006733]|uniref:STAS domain-containing protein n=1 Tax=Streptomyces sp. NPDC006733 TaxID=3155460 RepID=UPI0033C2D16C